jgi:hypothetical protein
MGEKRDRDVEKVYSTSEFVAKLRRLADALEAGERFEIRVARERVYVPARAARASNRPFAVGTEYPTLFTQVLGRCIARSSRGTHPFKSLRLAAQASRPSNEQPRL